MGDHADGMDVERFMRSPEGKRCMGRFRESVAGKRIAGVDFANRTCGVGITLRFEGGDSLNLDLAAEAFAVGSIRERYAAALDRAYQEDYPDRAPTAD